MTCKQIQIDYITQTSRMFYMLDKTASQYNIWDKATRAAGRAE